MNQSSDILLASLDTKGVNSALKKLPHRRVDLFRPGQETGKSLAMARYIEKVGGIVSVEKIVGDYHEFKCLRGFPTPLTPDEMEALSYREPVGLQPTLADHDIHHALEHPPHVIVSGHSVV